MPRFVILRHELPTDSARASHWDLMFEFGGVLRTWAIESRLAAGVSIPAKQLADHRLDYLSYEGPIAGDRGHVTRIDAGQFTVVADLPERLELVLGGSSLRGRLALADTADGWTVLFTPGGAAPR